MDGPSWYRAYFEALLSGELHSTERDLLLLQAIGPRVLFFKQRTEAFERRIGKWFGHQIVLAVLTSQMAQHLALINRDQLDSYNAVGSYATLLKACGFRLRADWFEQIRDRVLSHGAVEDQTWVTSLGGPSKAARRLVEIMVPDCGAATIERVQRYVKNHVSEDDEKALVNSVIDPEYVNDFGQRLVESEAVAYIYIPPERDRFVFVTPEQYELGKAGKTTKRRRKAPRISKGGRCK